MLNNFRYADDTVVLADKLDDRQNLLNIINEIGIGYGLNINVSKIKFVVFSIDPYANATLHVQSDKVKRIISYKFLGAWICDDLDPDKKIRARIEIAKAVFTKMRPIFSNKDLNLKLFQRII